MGAECEEAEPGDIFFVGSLDGVERDSVFVFAF